MPRKYFILFAFLFAKQVQAQPLHEQDSARKSYLAALKVLGRSFTKELYPNYAAIYSLPEKVFTAKIDSVRKLFNSTLNNYMPKLDAKYAREQQAEIKYYFDRLLIEYPLNHPIYTGKSAPKAYTIPQRLKGNLADLNKPELLGNSDFTDYVKAYLAYQTTIELKRPVYKNADNKHLNAVWSLIPKLFTEPACRQFWQYRYLYDHIENNGIKHIETIYAGFKAACSDTAYLNKVNAVYTEDSAGRQGHLIKTYKTAGTVELDMHLFLPDSVRSGNKRPVIVYFHGGSWSEGKPDWFFYSCENYAKKGWVACAVEYRTYGRHGTLPFDAVMDARSAIRWLRQHAGEYNIDTGKIAASGNSAGGHLVLCTALADKWNAATDDVKFGPTPNALLINSGVYDLTDQSTAWIRKDLKDKNTVKEISPVHLLKKDLPPTLIFHGTRDQNVSYTSAQRFVTEMAAAGNKNIEFHTLENAGHFIWYDPKYSSQIADARSDLLLKAGFNIK